MLKRTIQLSVFLLAQAIIMDTVIGLEDPFYGSTLLTGFSLCMAYLTKPEAQERQTFIHSHGKVRPGFRFFKRLTRLNLLNYTHINPSKNRYCP